MLVHSFAYTAIACLMLCFLPGVVSAQENHVDNDMAHHHHEDEEETTKEVSWYTWESLFDPEFLPASYADTSLASFHQYDFYRRGNPLYASKGNIGHIVRPLIFSPSANLKTALHQHKLYPYYFHNPDSIRFYRPEHVFSELFYVLGSDREQMFYAKHNQRLGEQTYGGFKYKTISSPGRYSRNGSSTSNLMLYAESQPFEGYHAAGSFVINRIFNQESGGLSDHEAFEEDEVQAFMILENAESRTRDLGVRIEQSYQPGVLLENDTLPSFNPGTIRHAFTYHRQAFVFEETSSPSPEFYEDANPFNDQFTLDSASVHNVINTLRWTNRSPDSGERPLLRYDLSLTHHVRIIRQPLHKLQLLTPGELSGEFYKDRHSHFQPGMRISSDPGRAFSFSGFAAYTFGGYHDNDYRAGGYLLVGRENRSIRLKMSAQYAEEEAPYFMHHMRSNYVRWENDFRKTQTLHLGTGLLHPAVRLHANYYLINHGLFMDTAGYPQQHEDALHVLSAEVKARLDAGLFRTRHHIVFHVTDEDNYERFPALLSHHSLYASFSLFDDALKAHTGFDVRFNTPYKPMAYIPMVRHFALQDTYETGHDLLVDVFVNAQIGRARLFVKLENIADLITDPSPVYEIPFYPVPTTMFKFGISWMFFD